MSAPRSRRLPLAITLCCALLLVGGCSSAPFRTVGVDRIALRQAERDLSTGIRAYEEGEYPVAVAHLQSALNGGLMFTPDKVAAHKYLGFVHCAAGRTQQCRGEFRQALALDPDFELTKAEAGHPAWGPVFRSVRDEATGSQRR